MENSNVNIIRNFIQELLENLGDKRPFINSEALFSSGRLDSFSMMKLVLHLEEVFSLDFSDFEFDVALVDSIDAIAALVSERAKA